MACILRPGVRAWTNGQLPFTIRKTGFTPQALKHINDAIEHWNTKTDWNIFPRNTHTHYVQFRVGNACSSEVGRVGGRQVINLSNGCGFGGAVHEIAHAVGFEHEHSRRDRDNHVVAMTERVGPNHVHNFARVRASKYLDYGLYDYGSIMHYDGVSFLRPKRHNWSDGWSNVHFYSISGETYLFMLKTRSGVVHGHRMDAAVGVDREIQRFDWTSGWTTSETFTVGNSTYLFLLKYKNGVVHIHRMNDDGTVGSRVKNYDWSDGWSTAEFYRVGGQNYLFLLKYNGGVVHIHRMNDDGTVGSRVKKYNWSDGWSSAKFYRVGGRDYLFLLKYSGGVVHIQRMNDDGTVGSRVKNYDWSDGWSSVRFFSVGGKVYLFLLKAGNGVVHIHRMNDDGKVGSRVDTRDWSSGWTSTEFYSVGGDVFLFLLKRSSGIVHIHKMRSDGKVGRELLLTPEITMYAPQSIGQRSGLSPGDIAAANARI